MNLRVLTFCRVRIITDAGLFTFEAQTLQFLGLFYTQIKGAGLTTFQD
jgi:hypothetical protein